MARPTIFISSTVHDFSDMRSALKDYLETRGCRVLSSEFADFPRALDRHSYQECLDTIELADVFVLLIGKRVGGWYDETKRISITRAEFEHAVELARAGRIRILAFVRKDVLDYHQASKELRKKLAADPTLDGARREDILYRDTQFMDDPRALIDFIDAVTRNRETAAAVRGAGTPPVANWIQPFSGFAEVRQAIEPLVTGGFEVGRAAGRKALEVQLLMLLQGILPRRVACGVSSPGDEVQALVGRIDLPDHGSASGVRVEHGAFSVLEEMSTAVAGFRADPAPLRHALTTDLLMSFDPARSAFDETPEYLLLARIVADCHALSMATDRSAELRAVGMGCVGGQAVTVDARLLEAQLVRLMRWADLVGGVRSLARSLRGGALHPPASLAASPLRRLQEAQATEQVTLDDARAYVDAWCPA